MAAHQASPAELQERIKAERTGSAFLVLRDGEGAQRILLLDGTVAKYSVGRAKTSDVCLRWDREVSRLHAELESAGSGWTVSDNGLSRNGTFVNDQRVKGR